MRRVEWSPYALELWKEIAHYIAFRFGKQAVVRFEQNIAAWESRIAQNPDIVPLEPLLREKSLKHKYYGVVIHYRCKMIYYFNEEVVYIVALWDTRREPDVLSKEL